MERPPFENIDSFDEFKKYYWYREELQDICKKRNLEYDADKKELIHIIESYFDGIIISHRPKMKIDCKTNILTLDTSLIECGFTFGPKFRDFYISQTNDKNFKFTADMVATAKAVKQNKDKDFTLRDLLDIKTGKRTYAVFDKSSCQWNQFLKDFCADEINDIYIDKLKTASKFWKILRDSDLPKVYKREFIEKYKDKI